MKEQTKNKGKIYKRRIKSKVKKYKNKKIKMGNRSN